MHRATAPLVVHRAAAPDVNMAAAGWGRMAVVGAVACMAAMEQC